MTQEWNEPYRCVTVDSNAKLHGRWIS